MEYLRIIMYDVSVCVFCLSVQGRWTRFAVANDPNVTGDYHGQYIGAPFHKLLLYGSKTTRDGSFKIFSL